ncbi:MAG: hypothetical protein ACOYO1_10720 [Bacteroidales bacterium]
MSILASIGATLYVIKLFKPKICISNPEIFFINPCEKNENKEQKVIKAIRVPIKNLSKKYAAINLRTEVCVVNGKFTYHFDLDRQDFIMISINGSPNESDERAYIGYKVAEFTYIRTCYDMGKMIDELTEKDAFLRVRVHASHEFTGFGKVFEATFKYQKEAFTAISDKYVCFK